MKKILLSAMALVAAMSVNAQVFKVSAEANGIGSDAVDVEAGKVWGSIEGALDISNPFATQHKAVDCKNNDFNKVVIDGNEIETKDGIQGQDNPKDAEGGNSAVTFKEATGGAVIQIDAKKNGWVYIVAKLSTNKQYIVFEEGAPIGYKIAMENTDERVKGGVLNLEIKGEGEYNNLTLDKYPNGLMWVIREYLGDAEAATAGNGLGVFYFPVAEGCKYYAHATGSKISWSGIYFSETEAKSVTVEGEGISKTLVGEGGSSSTGSVQAFKVSAEANGIGSDAVDVEAGKVWGSIEGALDISNPFATQHKAVDCKNNDFIKVVIDGTEVETKDGVQGQDNPKDADGGNSAVTFKEATGGAVIQIDAKKNGWVYIVAKLSTNKQYMVFEEGAPIGYKIAMESADERVKDGVLNLEIKGEGEYNNLTLDKYPNGLMWVIREYLGNAEAETAGNGLGVFYFPVAEGCKYYAHATGSKISWSGICFSETEAKSVTVEGEGISKTLIGAGTGINRVNAEKVADNAIYNLAGQKVNASYKGVVIKNGKKFLQK
jgi:hypothetical protein